jgi:hypothetical protein
MQVGSWCRLPCLPLPAQVIGLTWFNYMREGDLWQ